MDDRQKSMIDGRSVDELLRRAWRRQRRFVSARGLCHALIAACLLVAASFLLDWRLCLPPAARWVLIGATVAVLLAVAYASWWRWLRSYDPARVAIQLEGLYPELKSTLVSHVQLSRQLGRADGVSPALIRAVGRDAAEKAGRVDFRRIVNFAHLKWPLLFALVLLAVLAGSAIVQPGVANVFLARMLSPSTLRRYPTRTLLEPLTAGCHIQEGDKLALAARAGGEVPNEGILMIWPSEGGVENIRLAGRERQPGTRNFAHSMDAVYRSFRYAFHVGDAVSETFEVRVFPAPSIRPQLTVQYPQYTGRQPETLDSLSTTALEGSQIRWHLKADRPLKRAELLPDGEKPVVMDLSDDGQEACRAMPLRKTLTYGVRWTDLEHGFVYTPAAHYCLQVEPDRPPRVLLVAPSRDEKITVQKQLEISFRATDDNGLSAARIVFTVENRGATAAAEQYHEIPCFKNCPREANVEKYRWTLRKSLPDLMPGDVVRCAVEVLDNRPGTPGVARSESRRLTVLSPQEYAKMFLEERNRLLFRLNQVYDEERRAAGAVERLRVE